MSPINCCPSWQWNFLNELGTHLPQHFNTSTLTVTTARGKRLNLLQEVTWPPWVPSFFFIMLLYLYCGLWIHYSYMHKPACKLAWMTASFKLKLSSYLKRLASPVCRKVPSKARVGGVCVATDHKEPHEATSGLSLGMQRGRIKDVAYPVSLAHLLFGGHRQKEKLWGRKSCGCVLPHTARWASQSFLYARGLGCDAAGIAGGWEEINLHWAPLSSSTQNNRH